MGTGSVLLLVSGMAVGISALFIPTCQPGQVQCWNNRDAQLQSRLYWSGGLVLGRRGPGHRLQHLQREPRLARPADGPHPRSTTTRSSGSPGSRWEPWRSPAAAA